MPVIALLRHCSIIMYFEDHNPPHFHVRGHDGREAEILIEGLIVQKGNAGRRAMKEALDWAGENGALLWERWDDFGGR